ncbi:MAG TPA: lysophospholipid acyltransferase family protein [Polyangiaceae bacterium]|nr:lysophospholipid acyltransferase family protein [Polyangiaceae bacterium]
MFSAGVFIRAAYETAKICVPTIVDGLLGRVDARVCDRRLDSWSKQLVLAARITVETRGREHVVGNESFVVMSNHQSHFDIPVVFQALGIPVRMVAKRELFKIPIMGSAMHYSGFIEVDRARHTKAMRSLNAARTRLLADQTSVWIAPEGTRSLDGSLGKFKRGGFNLAIDAGLRILPVCVDGTLRVLRAKDSHVHKDQTVRVIIQPPIDAPSYGRGRADELVRAVRESIEDGLRQSAAASLA